MQEKLEKYIVAWTKTLSKGNMFQTLHCTAVAQSVSELSMTWYHMVCQLMKPFQFSQHCKPENHSGMNPSLPREVSMYSCLFHMLSYLSPVQWNIFKLLNILCHLKIISKKIFQDLHSYLIVSDTKNCLPIFGFQTDLQPTSTFINMKSLLFNK